MATNSAMSKAVGKKAKDAVTTRRYWTKQEEEVLLNLLEHMVINENWKSDGTFQGGYMLRLEREMNEKLPGCGLTRKNIKSKMTVWKKTHFAIRGMLACSGAAGFSMDPILNVIIEDKPDAWVEYSRAYPNETKMVKGKKHPWHIRWKFIFGTDNAAGGERVDFSDARDVLRQKGQNSFGANGQNAGNVNTDDGTPSNYDGVNTENVEEDSSSEGSTKEVAVPKATSSKKRKALVDDPGQIGMMIGEWMETTKSEFGTLTGKMLGNPAGEAGQPPKESSKRALIYSAVAEASNLEMEDIIKVTRHLSHNDADQEIFWGMPIAARSLFIGMILDGKSV